MSEFGECRGPALTISNNFKSITTKRLMAAGNHIKTAQTSSNLWPSSRDEGGIMIV
jgi:hypothetical protein